MQFWIMIGESHGGFRLHQQLEAIGIMLTRKWMNGALSTGLALLLQGWIGPAGISMASPGLVGSSATGIVCAGLQEAETAAAPQEGARPETRPEGARQEPSAERGERRLGGPGAGGPGAGGPGRRGGRPGQGGRGPEAAAARESAPGEPTLPQAWADLVTWRSIGPANMGGRITALAVNEKDPSMWWAATASGGLLKTTNNGNDFEHQFDREATVSIGDVQVAASNPDIVWVGTGEANPRNSVSWGDGVYKSVDGGKTWKNMGLRGIFQTGRIAIHPENPDIVYVGGLGRLWGPNEERGLFKTVDGGTTWEKIHYVDDKTGVIDVQMNPKNPDELFIATYERLRDGFDGNDPIKRFGPGSGIWKTTDGGKTFKKLTEGLPSCNLGRIGLDVFQRDPRFVIAIVESEKIANIPEKAPFFGVRGEDADAGSRITEVIEESPAAKAGLKVDDIILRADGAPVLSHEQLLKAVRKHQAGETLKLEVARARELVTLTVELAAFPEGARQSNPYTGTLGGQAENLQDQQGPDGKEYGGIYLSSDSGETWTRINTLNPRPMYYSQIRFDPNDRKNVYVCGTDLYRSFDGGKTFKADGVTDGIHVDHHALWIDPRDPRHMILGNDGGIYVTWDRMEHWDHHNHVAIGQFYHADVDSRADYRVYGGLQDNGSWGGPARSGRDSGPVNTDWFSVGGGDGFVTLVDRDDPDQIYFESQNGGMGRLNLRTGERGFMRPRAQRGVQYRFNWMTPFLLSPHNSKIFYAAGNYVFRSLKKGDELVAISPEITNTSLGSGSALAESPVEAGVLYVGTTDGAVWVSRNGGQSWEPIFSRPEEKKPEAEEKKDGDSQPADATADAKAAEEKADAAKADAAKTGEEKAAGDKPAAESGEARPAGRGNRTRRGDRPAGEEAGEAKPKTDEPKTDEPKTDEPKTDKPKSDEPKTEEPKPDAPKDPVPPKADFKPELVIGTWTFAGTDSERQQNPLVGTSLKLECDRESGAVKGQLVGRRGEYELENAKWDAGSGKLTFSTSTPIGLIVFEGTIKDKSFTGNAGVGSDAPPLEFRYSRDGKEPAANAGQANPVPAHLSAFRMVPGSSHWAALLSVPVATAGNSLWSNQEPAQDEEKAKEQKAEGSWSGVVENDAIPGGRLEFTIVLERNRSGALRGSLESVMGNFEITDGNFNPTSGKLTFAAGNDEVTIDFEARIEGDTMTGNAMVADDGNQIDFVAKRMVEKGDAEQDPAPAAEPKPEDKPAVPPAETKPADAASGADAAAAKAAEAAAAKAAEAVPAAGKSSSEMAAQAAADQPAGEKQEPAATSPLVGKWTGTMSSDQAPGGRGGRGMGEFTLQLSQGAEGKIAGKFSTQRGEGVVTEAKLEDGKVRIAADNGRMELVFEGKLAGEKMSGTVDFGGNFSMDFAATRTGAVDAAVAAETTGQGAAGDGKKLEELVPGPRWVSSLTASRFRAGRVYLSLDGHRSNDDDLYLFVSEDYGTSWKSIRGNLPASAGSVRVLREDLRRENILYAGCEFSAWVSVDRGVTWTRFGGLPTVAVHEFAQHPVSGDVVAATHGRSLWVADVTALRQFSADSVNKPAMLYQPAKVIRWQSEPQAGDSGTRRFIGQNPSSEATLFYSLGENARSVELTIHGPDGNLVQRFSELPLEKGLHSVQWNLREQAGPANPGRGGGGGPRFSRTVRPGEYLVTLRVGNEEMRSTLTIAADPDLPDDAIQTAEEEFELDFDSESARSSETVENGGN